jgi:hypothetical protein
VVAAIWVLIPVARALTAEVAEAPTAVLVPVETTDLLVVMPVAVAVAHTEAWVVPTAAMRCLPIQSIGCTRALDLPH